MKSLTLILALVLTSPVFGAQSSSGSSAKTPSATSETVARSFTGGLINGRYWQVIRESEKLSYLTGFFEALEDGGALRREEYFAGSMNKHRVVAALDKLYKQPENLPVPVATSLVIIKMTADGKPAMDIQLALESARNLAARPAH
jgi:hypothetical protein